MKTNLKRGMFGENTNRPFVASTKQIVHIEQEATGTTLDEVLKDLEEKKIEIDDLDGKVEGTVVEDGGEPSVDVGVVNEKINFAFKNLKGEKGEDGNDGNDGAPGPAGPQGPQGDSVIVGEGDLPMAHVLGDDNTKAMSQKGVSDILVEYATVEKALGTSGYSNVLFTVSSGKWASASKYRTAFIPVTPNTRYRITAPSGNGLNIGYLQDTENVSNGQSVHFAGGTTSLTSITAGNTYEFTTPSDCNFLCYYSVYNNVQRTIKEFVQKISVAEAVVNKVSLEDIANSEIGKKLDLAKYGLYEIDVNWISTDDSAIYAEEDGNDVIINIISNASHKRCGFSIADVNVGETLLFDLTVADNKEAVFGWANNLSDSEYNHIRNAKKYFVWTKTLSTQKYVHIPASSYSSNTILTLENFKVYKVATLTEINNYIQELKNSIPANSVEKIFSTTFQPSSYIPCNESKEALMDLNATNYGQGGTIYGNYFIQGFTVDNPILQIYSLTEKTLVQEVALPQLSNPRYHSNTLSFSAQKYDNGDDFPLLYLCSGYTDSDSVTTTEVYVLRIVKENNVYSCELVQTITLDFGTTWTEFVVDASRNRAWVTGTGVASYACYELPAYDDGDVLIDSETPIIDKFWVNSFTIGTSQKSSRQGLFFKNGRIYYPSGVPTRSEEGRDALFVVVVNTMTHCIETIVPLANFGLSGGTSAYEPESCFIWNNEFYVAYRSKIWKLIQN